MEREELAAKTDAIIGKAVIEVLELHKEAESYPMGWTLVMDYIQIGDPVSDSRSLVLTPDTQLLTQSLGQLLVAKNALFAPSHVE